MRAGVRYMLHSPELQAILVRIAAFTMFASASWALMPLLVRQELQGGPATYGTFLACLGSGAVAGAFILPHVRRRISRDWIVAGATVLFAISMLALAHSGSIVAGMVAMFLSGLAWISGVSSLMAAAQVALPAWVRARGLAFFWVVFMGSMAIGSTIWGQVAKWVGIPASLTISAVCAIVCIGAVWRFRVGGLEVLDLTPAAHWTTPHYKDEQEMDRGPVMITIEYLIEPSKLDEFAHALHHVRRLRRRDGAFLWEMFTDVEQPGRVIECFMVESWLEHLRQHERATVADKHIYKKARVFHLGGKPPHVTHYIAGHLRERHYFW
ncbi:MAG: MFS transporter, partial [Burkholderiaceae bacterium]|nr:MFS transporter [Burkholderiaceae bacterium]